MHQDSSKSANRKATAGIAGSVAVAVAACWLASECRTVDGTLRFEPSIPDPVPLNLKFRSGENVVDEAWQLPKQNFLQLLDYTEECGRKDSRLSFVNPESVTPISNRLWEIAGADKVRYIMEALNFVKDNIPYVKDQGNYFSWWKLPSETDFTKPPMLTLAHGGDCEDLSVFLASLFAAKEIPTGLVFSQGHCAVGFELDEVTDKEAIASIVPGFKALGRSFRVNEIAPINGADHVTVAGGTLLAQIADYMDDVNPPILGRRRTIPLVLEDADKLQTSGDANWTGKFTVEYHDNVADQIPCGPKLTMADLYAHAIKNHQGSKQMIFNLPGRDDGVSFAPIMRNRPSNDTIEITWLVFPESESARAGVEAYNSKEPPKHIIFYVEPLGSGEFELHQTIPAACRYNRYSAKTIGTVANKASE